MSSQGEFLAYGDSKTASDKYQPILCQDLLADNKMLWTYTTFAASGRTAALGAGAIDAEIAGSSANPSVILFNLGVNDLDALPAEATWKADIQYILSALNTKWPAATIIMMQPAKSGFLTEAATVAGWIADLIALNSYCQLGPDEAVWLENGDNFATLTDDGIHPNPAGQIVEAQVWQTAMGY